MVCMKQKPTDTQKRNRRKSKHTTIEKSSNHKGREEERKEQRNYKQAENNEQNGTSRSPDLSVITSNVNGLNLQKTQVR